MPSNVELELIVRRLKAGVLVGRSRTQRIAAGGRSKESGSGRLPLKPMSMVGRLVAYTDENQHSSMSAVRGKPEKVDMRPNRRFWLDSDLLGFRLDVGSLWPS
jgi:hypothetical protein